MNLQDHGPVTRTNPPVLPYDGSRPPQKPARWPLVAIAAIAFASCVAYGSYFAGLISADSLETGIVATVYVVVPVAAIVAGIRYGTQKKDYWV
jgi:hypothetical protein